MNNTFNYTGFETNGLSPIENHLLLKSAILLSVTNASDKEEFDEKIKIKNHAEDLWKMRLMVRSKLNKMKPPFFGSEKFMVALKQMIFHQHPQLRCYLVEKRFLEFWHDPETQQLVKDFAMQNYTEEETEKFLNNTQVRSTLAGHNQLEWNSQENNTNNILRNSTFLDLNSFWINRNRSDANSTENATRLKLDGSMFKNTLEMIWNRKNSTMKNFPFNFEDLDLLLNCTKDRKLYDRKYQHQEHSQYMNMENRMPMPPAWIESNRTMIEMNGTANITTEDIFYQQHMSDDNVDKPVRNATASGVLDTSTSDKSGAAIDNEDYETFMDYEYFYGGDDYNGEKMTLLESLQYFLPFTTRMNASHNGSSNIWFEIFQKSLRQIQLQSKTDLLLQIYFDELNKLRTEKLIAHLFPLNYLFQKRFPEHDTPFAMGDSGKKDGSVAEHYFPEPAKDFKHVSNSNSSGLNAHNRENMVTYKNNEALTMANKSSHGVSSDTQQPPELDYVNSAFLDSLNDEMIKYNDYHTGWLHDSAKIDSSDTTMLLQFCNDQESELKESERKFRALDVLLEVFYHDQDGLGLSHHIIKTYHGTLDATTHSSSDFFDYNMSPRPVLPSNISHNHNFGFDPILPTLLQIAHKGFSQDSMHFPHSGDSDNDFLLYSDKNEYDWLKHNWNSSLNFSDYEAYSWLNESHSWQNLSVDGSPLYYDVLDWIFKNEADSNATENNFYEFLPDFEETPNQTEQNISSKQLEKHRICLCSQVMKVLPKSIPFSG